METEYREKVKNNDAKVYELLTDPVFKSQIIPDGKYRE